MVDSSLTNPNRYSNWLVSESDGASERPSTVDLVMAWARDQDTGEPRYIGELKNDQRGSKCNCECVSCGLPLIAINAAKTIYRKRPHFRHPEGAEKDSCLVLAARFAALELLKSEGVLELPRHRKSAGVTGLSGSYYEAWVELPPEIVRISNFDFCDKVSAILTLEDGRELKIQLVGRVDTNETDSTVSLIPTILLIVDDPSIAAMSPNDLRKRIRLIVDDGIWCAHWNDLALISEANNAALAKAEIALDWLDDLSGYPADMSAELVRETLLHIKAKEILEREKRIVLPAIFVEVEATLPSGDILTKRKCLPEQLVQLESVVLEKRVGRIRPDVVARTIAVGEWLAEQILIEITVTNFIDDERIGRITREGHPALEIDISRMGGVVTEDEFARLIIEELAGKRWLFHPRLEQEIAGLEIELAEEVQIIIEAERKDAEAKSISAAEWGRRYLEAVILHGNLRAHSDEPDNNPEQLKNAFNYVRECEKNLASHGYVEANVFEFFRLRTKILERLLSLKMNKAVGYKFDTAWQVINAILQEKNPYSQWQTLYLIGIKVWQPTLNFEQAKRVEKWREDVKLSIENGEKNYQRNRKYDKLLAFLFPELTEALAKPLKVKFLVPIAETNKLPSNSYQNNSQKMNSDFWLKGRALEAWKKENPESAEKWFKNNNS